MTEKTVRPHSVLRRTMLVGTAGVLGSAVFRPTPVHSQTGVAPGPAVSGSSPPGARYGDPSWWALRKEEILEQDSNRLNQKEDSHIWGFVIQDAGWGWGPASDGKTLFAGPAGSCDWFGCERPHVPGDGGAVWGERGQRCEVVAALAGERQRGGQADGRLETTAADKRTGVAAGADRREAGSDLARRGGRTG